MLTVRRPVELLVTGPQVQDVVPLAQSTLPVAPGFRLGVKADCQARAEDSGAWGEPGPVTSIGTDSSV